MAKPSGGGSGGGGRVTAAERHARQTAIESPESLPRGQVAAEGGQRRRWMAKTRQQRVWEASAVPRTQRHTLGNQAIGATLPRCASQRPPLAPAWPPTRGRRHLRCTTRSQQCCAIPASSSLDGSQQSCGPGSCCSCGMQYCTAVHSHPPHRTTAASSRHFPHNRTPHMQGLQHRAPVLGAVSAGCACRFHIAVAFALQCDCPAVKVPPQISTAKTNGSQGVGMQGKAAGMPFPAPELVAAAMLALCTQPA